MNLLRRAQLVCSRPPLGSPLLMSELSLCVVRAIDGRCRNDEDISNRHSFTRFLSVFWTNWGLGLAFYETTKAFLEVVCGRRQLFRCEGFAPPGWTERRSPPAAAAAAPPGRAAPRDHHGASRGLVRGATRIKHTFGGVYFILYHNSHRGR